MQTADTGMEDSYRHKGMRKQLVEQLALKGIADGQVLAAMEAVPRHWFIDSALLPLAYKDQAVPIGCGQSISQPYTVARQTEMLGVRPHDKVLEIGTGSGYQTAVLYTLKAHIYTIERQYDLFRQTERLLAAAGYKVRCFYGDGYKGLPAYAPFDRIIVTAAAPEIPKQLLQQLKVGGRMVIPVGEESQTMYVIDRVEENLFRESSHGDCRFVPFLAGRE